MLGCLSVLYTVIFMAIRAFDGSYTTGKLLAAVPAALAPAFDKASLWNLDANVRHAHSHVRTSHYGHVPGPSPKRRRTLSSGRRPRLQ